MSNIIVLSGSPRKGGNTDLLVDAFVKGAEKNNNVEVISVADYKVNPCIGCNSCFDREGHDCFQQDDMRTVYDKLKCADVIVVASPVYFYGVSAQLKAIIDRLHTPMRNDFKVKNWYGYWLSNQNEPISQYRRHSRNFNRGNHQLLCYQHPNHL